MSDIFARQLEALRARSLDRHLREISSQSGAIIDLDGKRLINFSSNDYLGLANDPQLREAATKAIAEFGIGAGSVSIDQGDAIAARSLRNRARKARRDCGSRFQPPTKQPSCGRWLAR
jgi:7-keto-8-aminopelargonate synthetase-like enzyme